MTDPIEVEIDEYGTVFLEPGAVTVTMSFENDNGPVELTMWPEEARALAGALNAARTQVRIQ